MPTGELRGGREGGREWEGGREEVSGGREGREYGIPNALHGVPEHSMHSKQFGFPPFHSMEMDKHTFTLG